MNNSNAIMARFKKYVQGPPRTREETCFWEKKLDNYKWYFI